MATTRGADLLVDQLRTMVRLVPDEVGFHDLDTGDDLTFAAWHGESNRLARGLVAAGVGRGDRVAVHVPGRDAIRWVLAYTAVHKAGAVAVPTNTRLTATELAHVLGHAEVTAAFTSPELLERFEQARARLGSLALVVGTRPGPGLTPWEEVLADDDSDLQVAVGADDLADIMYTSGTTGMPKGVAVTHANAATIPHTDPEWSGAGWIHSSPLFTFAGIGFVYNPMKLGMVSLHQPRFVAGHWLDHVERHRPTAAFVVPAMARLIVDLERFVEAELSSVQLCSVGSAPLPFDVLEALQEKLPDASVSNSYGMTEAGAAYCLMPPGEALERKGSVGLPLPPTEVTVVDGDGVELPAGEEGELLIRSSGTPRSYYQDPDATAEAWEPDGWLHTGDVATLDDDGFLYVVGRMKDVIIRGGHNVHAGEVESVLHEHPDVVDAAVAGVPHEVLGEEIAAFVVLHEGASTAAAATEAIEAIESFCREHLADYKAPRSVTVVDELPRNATGKLVRREVLRRFTGEERDT